MIRSHRVFSVSFILCSVGAVDCGGNNPTDGAFLVEAPEPIINGTVVANDVVGTPIISVSDTNVSPAVGFGCTGTMLTPTWMLTAHHCVTTGNLLTRGTAIKPGDLTVTIKGGTNSPRGVQIVRHPTLDVGLVRLSAAPVDGVGTTFADHLYRGSS